jgi:signal peptidase II
MSSAQTTLRTVLVAVVVVIADQVSKAIVRSQINPFGEVKLLPFLKLVRTENSGVAFSMFSSGGPLVVIVGLAALGALLYFYVTHIHRRLVWLPTGMLLGGAAGNLIDRAVHGGVTDFIKFPHWPQFNVADISITLGVLVLLVVLERGTARN